MRSRLPNQPEKLAASRSRTTRVRELLGIAPDLTIVVGVTVGHPAEDPDWDRASSVFSQRRRAHEEVVRWSRWA